MAAKLPAEGQGQRLPSSVQAGQPQVGQAAVHVDPLTQKAPASVQRQAAESAVRTPVAQHASEARAASPELATHQDPRLAAPKAPQAQD